MEKERLQKVIARAGIASRREAERIIEAGRVTVNGVRVAKLGTKVDPSRDHVKVDGKLITRREPLAYFLMNKPRGVLTTLVDTRGRRTLSQFLRRVPVRVFPVGRLDYDTDGLLLLTNDGDLTYRLLHPKHKVPKLYRAKISGLLEEAKRERLERGITLRGERGGEKLAPCRIRVIRRFKASVTVQVTLYEGRKRQIRRMFKALGHPVERLTRIAIGPLTVRGLAPGEIRRLTPAEIKRIRLAGGRAVASHGAMCKH